MNSDKRLKILIFLIFILFCFSVNGQINQYNISQYIQDCYTEYTYNGSTGTYKDTYCYEPSSIYSMFGRQITAQTPTIAWHFDAVTRLENTFVNINLTESKNFTDWKVFAYEPTSSRTFSKLELFGIRTNGDYIYLTEIDNSDNINDCSINIGNAITWNATIQNQESFSQYYINATSKTCKSGGTTYVFNTGRMNLLYNLPNNFPSVNFTADVLSCFNESSPFSPIPINLSISAYDPENHTVYYSLTTENVGNESSSIVFNRNYNSDGVLCSLTSPSCLPVPQYSFIENTNQNDYCDINENLNSYNLSQHNLILGNDYNSNFKYLFQLNGLCDDSPELLYRIPETLNQFWYDTFYGGIATGETFNISFLESDYTEILKFRISNTGSNFTLEYYNQTGFTTLYNASSSDFNSRVLFGFSTFSENITVYLTDETQTNLINLNSEYDVSKFTKYILHSTDENSQILIDTINYGGIYTKPTFSTSVQSSVSFNGAGYQPITLYYTDSYELDSNRFVSKTVYVRIEQCQYFETNTIGEIGGFLPIAQNPFKEYMKAVDPSGANLKKVLWLFLPFMLGFVLISEYMTFRRINFTFTLIGVSFLSVLVAFIFDSTAHLIAYLIVFALSFTPIIVGHVMKGDRYG